MSQEVQNMGISGPTKRTHVLQKFKKIYKKKNLRILCSPKCICSTSGLKSIEQIKEVARSHQETCSSLLHSLEDHHKSEEWIRPWHCLFKATAIWICRHSFIYFYTYNLILLYFNELFCASNKLMCNFFEKEISVFVNFVSSLEFQVTEVAVIRVIPLEDSHTRTPEASQFQNVSGHVPCPWQHQIYRLM